MSADDGGHLTAVLRQSPLQSGFRTVRAENGGKPMAKAARERLASLLDDSGSAGSFSAQIDAADLPVRHQTRRQGRPYTLVLTKADELFTREKDARHKAKADLAWLTSAWAETSHD
jgi:hypothetical protein